MKILFNIEELPKHLLPLTYLRRNAGKVLAQLNKVGVFIITKDGKPVAKLSTLKEEISEKRNEKDMIKKIKKVIGGFHLGKISPSKIKKIIYQQYERVLS